MRPITNVMRSIWSLELLTRHDVGQGEADAGDLAGEELGVSLRSFGDLAVVVGGQSVAAFLAVLGEQDQRRRVRGLQRQHQGEQHETAVPRVELVALGRQQVEGQPHDDHNGLPDEETRRAEVAGDRFAELTERLGVVGDVEPVPVARRGEVAAPFHDAAPVAVATPRCRCRHPAPSIRSTTSSTLTAPSRWPPSSVTPRVSMS